MKVIVACDCGRTGQLTDGIGREFMTWTDGGEYPTIVIACRCGKQARFTNEAVYDE